MRVLITGAGGNLGRALVPALVEAGHTPQLIYPRLQRLVAERGLDLSELVWGRTIWRVDKAKRLLGYQPRYNFDGFLEALEADSTDYYPFANLPWWGV